MFSIDSRPSVAILMAAYERPEFFAQQLESILGQRYQDWQLWISDDSASDDMQAVFAGLALRFGSQAHFRAGPHDGSVRNFLSLVCDDSIQADYYAFADHDDVWHADKLERAVAWLSRQPPEVPALYCGRVRLIDRHGRHVGLSPAFRRLPSFANALVQNLAGGNTMVFNDAARQLMQRAGQDVNVVVHDWWLYLAVAGCGGVVFYDDIPTLSYRLHGANQIGELSRVSRLQRRLVGLRERRLRAWIDQNLAALERLHDSLTPESAGVLLRFHAYRAKALGRMRAFNECGVYRQRRLDDMSLRCAAAMGWV